MLGDTKSPADLGSTGPGIGMRELPYNCPRHTRLALGVIERVALHTGPVLFKSAGGPLNEGVILKTGSNNSAATGDGERDVSPAIEAQPNVRPLRRPGAPRVDALRLGSVPHPPPALPTEHR